MLSAAVCKVVDKLPPWGKVIFWGLSLALSAYCISHYGLFHFLLRVTFST